MAHASQILPDQGSGWTPQPWPEFLNARYIGTSAADRGFGHASGGLIRAAGGNFVIPPVAAFAASFQTTVNMVDLRDPSELLQQDRTTARTRQEIKVIACPLGDARVLPPANLRTRQYFAGYYASLARPALGAVGEVLKSMAAGTSTLIVCQLGKDRTAVVAAGTLSALGLPNHAILDDYAESAKEFQRRRDWTSQYARQRGEAVEALLARLSLPPSVMRHCLDELEAILANQTEFCRLAKIDEATLRDARARFHGGIA